MKTCSTCGEVKPLDHFYWTTSHGRKYRHSKCQPCRRQQFKEWARTDRGKQVKRNGILAREYGLTEAGYEALHQKQGGLCRICGCPERKVILTRAVCRLAIDHDHVTGKVRGLLCSSCNVGLGSFQDSPRLLESAAAYLKAYLKENDPRGQAAKTEAVEKAALLGR